MTKTTDKTKKTPAKPVARKTTGTKGTRSAAPVKKTTTAKKTTAPKKKAPAKPTRQQIIRESLLKQLWKRGADVEFLEDVIDDYMKLYEIKERLNEDIVKRGINYEEPAANTGRPIVKPNPSVRDLATTSRQMLIILKNLGLTAEQVDPSGDEEL